MNACTREKALGALVGAAIGTSLGIAYGPGAASATLDAGPLPWKEPPPAHPHRNPAIPLTTLMAGVERAYVRCGGRVTPEDWAEQLKLDDALTGAGAFWLMDVYGAIELMREGMSPRLTGQHTTPSGQVVAVAPIVAVYHAGDPDGAYVDAMELASVVQRRPATDWAALLAAALAAALMPGATAGTVIATTLEVAERRAPDVAEALQVRLAAAAAADDFADYVRTGTGNREWYASDPLGWALALLQRLGDQPVAMMNLALTVTEAHVHALAAGALAGALHGVEAWPEGWAQQVRPVGEGLLPLLEAKLRGEAVVARELETVLQPGPGGEPLLFDKALGCILAGAIGNAMGSPAEGMLYTEVTARYGGPITTILQPDRLENEDDNQMAMHLTNTYRRLAGKQVTARDVGQTWMADMKREGFWLCCRNVYDQIRSGVDPRVAGHWNWVTGSTVMCMEPVGIYHLADPCNAYIDGAMISYMEQRGLDVTAAAILAASVAEAMRATATVDSVLRAALDAAPREKMLTFDARQPDNPHDYIALCLQVADKYDEVLASFPELYEKCLYYNQIDPLELLGLAYAMFKIADGDVRQAAIGGASIGRDADTICGRAAMLSGALRGAGAVPAEWVAMVAPHVLQGMQEAARSWVTLLGTGKLTDMKQRQALLQA